MQTKKWYHIFIGVEPQKEEPHYKKRRIEAYHAFKKNKYKTPPKDK